MGPGTDSLQSRDQTIKTNDLVQASRQLPCTYSFKQLPADVGRPFDAVEEEAQIKASTVRNGKGRPIQEFSTEPLRLAFYGS